ncbi:MAG: hypothetical protein PGN25_06170 [Methylorubrum populi]
MLADVRSEPRAAVPVAATVSIAPWSLPSALLAASLIGSAWLALPAPAPDRPVAALFPPWWNSARSLDAAAAAGGTVLGLGRLPGLVVTRSSAPGFAERLRTAGALVLFDPRGLGLCLPAKERLP